MDIEKIKELTTLIDATGVTEFKYEDKDIKLAISKAQQSAPLQFAPQQTHSYAPVQPSAPAAQPAPSAPPAEDQSIQVITAPLVGTFYSSPSPESSPFISIGERVKKGDTICIIEAMKLMNEIEAEVEGEVIAVLAVNSTPVEFGSPLFKIKKS